MYTRNYYPEVAAKPTPPENYDGCAFREDSPPSRDEVVEVSFNESENADNKARQSEESSPVSRGEIPILSGIFGKGGLLGGLNLRLPTIGTEEILILATAAFLFFSKGGDKESAIILLLLLLIN